MKKIVGIVILVVALIVSGIVYVAFKNDNKSEEKKEEKTVEQTLSVSQQVVNAIKNDDLEEFKQLILDNELSLDMFIDNNNLLHLTAIHNAIDIATYLLDEGVDVDVTNKDNNTALELSVINSSKEVFDLLVDNEIVNGEKPIYYALNNQDRQYLNRLLGDNIVYDEESLKLLKDDKDLLEEVLMYLNDEEQDDLLELLGIESDEVVTSGNNNNVIVPNPVTPTNPVTPPKPITPPNPVTPPTVDVTIEITSTPEEMVRAMENFTYKVTYDTNSESPVKFSIKNKPDFLVFDESTATLSGKPYYTDKKLYESIIITATTENASDKLEFDLLVDDSFIELALVDGDYQTYNIDSSDIVERNDFNLTNVSNECKLIKENVLDGVYEPSDFGSANKNWLSPIVSRNPDNIPIISANDGTDYFITGKFDNGSKYAVSGFKVFEPIMGEPLYNSNFSESIVKYLTDDPDFFTNGKTIYTNKVNEMKNYLDSRLGVGNYDTTFVSDFSTDVDFVYAQAPSSDIVTQSRDNEIPIMGFYNYWWANNDSISLFDVQKIDYPTKKTVNNYESFDTQCNYFKQFDRLLKTYENDALNIVNKEEACSVLAFKRTCDLKIMLNEDGNTLEYLFNREIYELTKLLQHYDYNNIDVFDLPSERVKLGVMLADVYRDNVTYNMSHNDSDDNVFYRAYYADSTINYARDTNFPKDDLGTFAPIDRGAIEEMSVQKGTYSFTPGEMTDWYTTGYYLKPGEKLTIKRTDSSTNEARVFLNMQRAKASRIWDNGINYIRPHVLSTHHIVVGNGEEVTYSSPHGGNIYIAVNNPSDQVEMSFEFDGVLPYPVLTEFDNASINKYIEELKTTPFKYTDFYTELASVHALKDKVIDGFEKYPGNESQYIDDINNYLIKGNYLYAGYESELIGTLPTNVSSYFINAGLNDYNSPTVNRLPRRQHINVDNKVGCGNLCSGNPFDMARAIDPFGHGDNHEMGHNLQTKYLNIYGNKSNELSNNIFPLNTRIQKDIADGKTTTDFTYAKPDNMSNLFTKFNADFVAGVPASEDTFAWEKTGLYDSINERFAFYTQLAQVTGGWHNYTKLYISSRLMIAYSSNDSDWETYKAKLGLSQYTKDEARALNANDFMAITSSLYTNKDLSDFFEGYGVAVSDKAEAQITANNPESVMPAGMFYLEYDAATNDIPIAASTLFIPFGEGNTYTKPE